MPTKSVPRWIAALLASLTTLLLLSCAGGTATSSCAGFAPIYPSRGDVMTPQTARQILTHNEQGAARCGWKP